MVACDSAKGGSNFCPSTDSTPGCGTSACTRSRHGSCLPVIPLARRKMRLGIAAFEKLYHWITPCRCASSYVRQDCMMWCWLVAPVRVLGLHGTAARAQPNRPTMVSISCYGYCVKMTTGKAAHRTERPPAFPCDTSAFGYPVLSLVLRRGYTRPTHEGYHTRTSLRTEHWHAKGGCLMFLLGKRTPSARWGTGTLNASSAGHT